MLIFMLFNLGIKHGTSNSVSCKVIHVQVILISDLIDCIEPSTSSTCVSSDDVAM